MKSLKVGGASVREALKVLKTPDGRYIAPWAAVNRHDWGGKIGVWFTVSLWHEYKAPTVTGVSGRWRTEAEARAWIAEYTVKAFP